jgi:hypothetical protein
MRSLKVFAVVAAIVASGFAGFYIGSTTSKKRTSDLDGIEYELTVLKPLLLPPSEERYEQSRRYAIVDAASLIDRLLGVASKGGDEGERSKELLRKIAKIVEANPHLRGEKFAGASMEYFPFMTLEEYLNGEAHVERKGDR